MGLSAPHRVWLLGQAVAKGTQLANPRRWGSLPFHLEKFKPIMPVLMHEKKITFGTIQTKHSHSRRSFIPNILFRPLYSRLLEMSIWTCISARALREVDLIGGLDEYLLETNEKKFGSDKVALMYRKRVKEARDKRDTSTLLNPSLSKMDGLLRSRYGAEYLEKVKVARLQ